MVFTFGWKNHLVGDNTCNIVNLHCPICLEGMSNIVIFYIYCWWHYKCILQWVLSEINEPNTMFSLVLGAGEIPHDSTIIPHSYELHDVVLCARPPGLAAKKWIVSPWFETNNHFWGWCSCKLYDGLRRLCSLSDRYILCTVGNPLKTPF